MLTISVLSASHIRMQRSKFVYHSLSRSVHTRSRSSKMTPFCTLASKNHVLETQKRPIQRETLYRRLRFRLAFFLPFSLAADSDCWFEPLLEPDPPVLKRSQTGVIRVGDDISIFVRVVNEAEQASW